MNDYDAILSEARSAKSAGRLNDAADMLERAIASTASTTRQRVELIRELVDVYARSGSWGRAHHRIDEGLRLLDEQPDEQHDDLQASLLERRAWVLFRQSRLQEAISIARPLASRLSLSGNSDALRADLHNTLGGIAWQQGDVDTAVEQVRRAAELYERARNTFGSANARMNLGILHFSRGEWPESAEAFEEADRLRRESGWATGRAASLLNLGLLHMAMGQHEQARREIEESLHVSHDAGEQYDVAHAYIALAQLDLTENRTDDACRHLDDALAAEDCICDDDRVQAGWLKALIECDRGGHERGVAIATDARKIAQHANLRESEADCCRALGIAYRRGKQYDHAERMLRESVALSEQVGDSYRRALALLELGATTLEAQRRDEARPHFDEATREFERLGAQHDLSRAHTARAALSV